MKSTQQKKPTAAPNAPQTDAQSPGNSSVEPTTQQILERAMENMHSRPMDPKTYNALFSYKNQLQHTNTTQTLLDQKRGILQQQASGASDAQIKRTMADIAKLENMLSSQKKTLQRAEQDPRLQQVIEKYGAEIVENRRKKDVAISETFDKIKAEGEVITDGSHIENGKLKPNVTYQTGEHEYLYQTNS